MFLLSFIILSYSLSSSSPPPTLPSLLLSFDLLMPFSLFLPLLITSFCSSSLYGSTCIHHIYFSLFLLNFIFSALSLSVSQQVKLMVTNPVVRGKWLDPNSSRNVIFSPCAVAHSRAGLRKAIEAWSALCVCMCVYPNFDFSLNALRGTFLLYWTVGSEEWHDR